MSGKKSAVNWEEVENEYISGELNLKELAEEWHISYETIRKRAAKEKWSSKIQELENYRRKNRLAHVSERLLIKIGEAIDKGELDAKDYKALSSALKELGEIKERLDQYGKQESTAIKVELSSELQELSR